MGKVSCFRKLNRTCVKLTTANGLNEEIRCLRHARPEELSASRTSAIICCCGLEIEFSYLIRFVPVCGQVGSLSCHPFSSLNQVVKLSTAAWFFEIEFNNLFLHSRSSVLIKVTPFPRHFSSCATRGRVRVVFRLNSPENIRFVAAYCQVC